MSTDVGSSPLDTFERELRRAATLLEEGRFEQAYTWATEALALRPAHLLAQNLLGLILYQQQRFGPALEIFEALVRKNPDVITLRMNAGLSALHGGELERALEHLRRAVDLDASHRRAFAALALAHLFRSEHHLAVAALQEASLEEQASVLGQASTEAQLLELRAELRTTVERLPPSAGADSPCEGFAEVGPLVPLEEWRRAEPNGRVQAAGVILPAVEPATSVTEKLPDAAAAAAPPGQASTGEGAEPAGPLADGAGGEEGLEALTEEALTEELAPTTEVSTGEGREGLEALNEEALTQAFPPSGSEPVAFPGEAAGEPMAAELPVDPADQTSATLELLAEPAADDELATPEISLSEPSPEAAADGGDREAPGAAGETDFADLAEPPGMEAPSNLPPARPDQRELPVARPAEPEQFDVGPTPVSMIDVSWTPAPAPEAHASRPPRDPGEVPRRPLADRLAILTLPGLDRAASTAIRHGTLIVRLREGEGGALVRPDHLLLEQGELGWRPASRRRKGAEAGPFSVDGKTLQLVSGVGSLVMRPGAGHLELLRLEEEGLYVREQLLLAASGELHWENGRLPGLSGEFGVVHLRGTGYLALCCPARPLTVTVGEQDTVRIRLEQLLGWTGSTVPQPVADPSMVGFSGAGVVILHLASLTQGVNRGP